MTSILFAMFILGGYMVQGSPTNPVQGTIHDRQVIVATDAGPLTAKVRFARVETHLPESQVARGEILILFEPRSHLVWWQYTSLEAGSTGRSDPLADLAIYIHGKTVYGFTFFRPFLWIRESDARCKNMDDAQEAVLAEISRNSDRLQSAMSWEHYVNVGMGMGFDFLNLKGDASGFPEPKLREVARKNGQWQLIFDGPNKDSAKIVLSDDYQVISTTHFPAKAAPAEPREDRK